MTRESRLDDGIQALVKALLVRVRDRLDLGIILARQDLAHLRSVLSDEATHASLQLGNSLFDLLRIDGVRVFGATSGRDHHVHLLRARAEVALEVCFECAPEELLILLFDRVDVGVAAPDKNIVKDDFLGAHALHGFHEVVAVRDQGATGDLDEAFLKVAAGLFFEVYNQVPQEALVVL